MKWGRGREREQSDRYDPDGVIYMRPNVKRDTIQKQAENILLNARLIAVFLPFHSFLNSIYRKEGKLGLR